MKVLFLVVLALCFLAAVNAEAVADSDKCVKFCDHEWGADSDESANCQAPCQDGVNKEITDCTADANSSKEERHPFYTGCSYGIAVGQDHSCDSFCKTLKFSHHLSKFFELGCRHICTKIVKARTNNPNTKCSNLCDSMFGIEACWRGCSYAVGLVEGHDQSDLSQ